MNREDVKKSTFNGRSISELSREELFDVIASIIESNKIEIESHQMTLRMYELSTKRLRRIK